MGFFDWLMKGVGFESDGENAKPKKDKKHKHDDASVVEDVPQSETELKDFSQNTPEEYSYDAFGNLDANKFSASSNLNDDFAPENGVGGFGTKNVVIHKPKTYKEVQGLIDYLKQGESAIMILDGLSQAEAQRILDFVSGAVYALNGSTQRVEGNIFLLTPEGYNIVS